jgi:hypothetical protein
MVSMTEPSWDAGKKDGRQVCHDYDRLPPGREVKNEGDWRAGSVSDRSKPTPVADALGSP